MITNLTGKDIDHENVINVSPETNKEISALLHFSEDADYTIEEIARRADEIAEIADTIEVQDDGILIDCPIFMATCLELALIMTSGHVVHYPVKDAEGNLQRIVEV